jgi:hypothetical protein
VNLPVKSLSTQQYGEIIMYTYYINVAINGKHFFDIICEPHRYSENDVAHLAKIFREKFEGSEVSVTRTSQAREHTGL